jgi:hypothetical protein
MDIQGEEKCLGRSKFPTNQNYAFALCFPGDSRNSIIQKDQPWDRASSLENMNNLGTQTTLAEFPELAVAVGPATQTVALKVYQSPCPGPLA